MPTTKEVQEARLTALREIDKWLSVPNTIFHGITWSHEGSIYMDKRMKKLVNREIENFRRSLFNRIIKLEGRYYGSESGNSVSD